MDRPGGRGAYRRRILRERERETEENVSGEMGRLTLRKSGREKVK